MNKGNTYKKIWDFLATKWKSIVVSISIFIICFATIYGNGTASNILQENDTNKDTYIESMTQNMDENDSTDADVESDNTDAEESVAENDFNSDAQSETFEEENTPEANVPEANAGEVASSDENAGVNENGVLSYYDKEKEERYNAYAKKYPKKSYEQVVMEVNIGIDKGFFTDAAEVTNPDDILVLVNKFNYLTSDYEPKDMVQLPEEYSNGKLELRQVAAEALDELIMAAKEDGYNINVVSAYRSYKTQERLYSSYVERSGEEAADSYSARPGYSEHQTGLAVDLQAGNYKYNDFAKTEESKYVAAHAHEYGFILRYQTGKRYITGYIPEAWHIRYVGKEVATIIYNEELTYEEYCVKYR